MKQKKFKKLQLSRSSRGSSINSSTNTISTVEMEKIVDKLSNENHRNSTKRNYLSVWRSFNRFYIRLDRKPESWEDRLVLFVGFLIQNKKKSSTIKSYISAIRAMLQGIKVKLQENVFLIKALTRACRLHIDKVHTRQPIHRNMLVKLLAKAKEKFKNQPYLSLLYRTIFTTAYFGLFRIGELTTSDHPVKAVDVKLAKTKKKVKFILRSSKTHGKESKPQIVKISSSELGAVSRKANNAIYPFKLIKKYIAARKSCLSRDEPFFIFRDRSPVKVHHVNAVLKDLLLAANYDTNLFSFHSLRGGGRAQDLLKLGLSIETIKRLGRWKSNAIYNYLKE